MQFRRMMADLEHTFLIPKLKREKYLSFVWTGVCPPKNPAKFKVSIDDYVLQVNSE